MFRSGPYSVYILESVKGKIKGELLRVHNQLYSTTKESPLCFKGSGGCRASPAQQESAKRIKGRSNRVHKQYVVILETGETILHFFPLAFV